MASATASKPALRIILTRSPIGTPRSHRVLLRGLGLRRIRHAVVRPDTAQVRGLIHRLRYMIRVERAD